MNRSCLRVMDAEENMSRKGSVRAEVSRFEWRQQSPGTDARDV